MKDADIVQFVRHNTKPLIQIAPYGAQYRISATMKDGTFLPCVIVQDRSAMVELAIKRFDELRNSEDLPDGHRGMSKIRYRSIVSTFVTWGNGVNGYELKEFTQCRFAISPERLAEIRGETSMSWTEFYAEMHDGQEFRFGTTFSNEFFEMPQGYSAVDIQRITPAVRDEKSWQATIYREKPFFICYVDGL